MHASLFLRARNVRGGGGVSSIISGGTILPLEFFPSPVLRAICAAVVPGGGRALSASLIATAASHDALGLAAPQVGTPSRIFALRVPAGWTSVTARRAGNATRANAAHGNFFACVNPRVVSRGTAVFLGLEACLSLPDTSAALIRRSSEIRVSYTNGATGEVVETDLDGLPAAVFQHELDHLDGVLITDVAEPVLRGNALDEAQEAFHSALSHYYAV